MRVFCASLATETNTFSPLRTDFSDFEQGLYAPPGSHPDGPTLCSAVFPALRRRARRGEITLLEGTAAWAEPGGLLNQRAWTRLRDEILSQLRDAMPVRAVLLGLHGAMIAERCLDPEGELIEAVRGIVGPDVAVGATFDPHSHLSARRARFADVIVAFKEFPHTDFVETGEDCVALTLAAARGEVRPEISVHDARMIDMLPTHRQPMRGFIDRLRSLERANGVCDGDGRGSDGSEGESHKNGTRENGILSVSVIHGFMAGDSPNLGAKVVVVTDGDRRRGDDLARRLADELFSFRGTTRPRFFSAREALERADSADVSGDDGAARAPVVVADVWDNPGGGVAGDSTILLREALRMRLRSAALATLWDPMAVRLCFAAGEGAVLQLRFGGKTSASAGAPIDARVTVTRLRRNASQRFGDSTVYLGDCAAIRIHGVGEKDDNNGGAVNVNVNHKDNDKDDNGVAVTVNVQDNNTAVNVDDKDDNNGAATVTVNVKNNNGAVNVDDKDDKNGGAVNVHVNGKDDDNDGGGIEVVLNSRRAQTFSPDAFSNMGIDPAKKRVLIVKSSNHFQSAFAPIAADILYAGIDGLYPSDPKKTRYTRLHRPLWPMVEDPHAAESE